MTLCSIFVRLLAVTAVASAGYVTSKRPDSRIRDSAAVQATGPRRVVDKSDGASYMRTAQLSKSIVVGVYESLEGDNQVLRVVGSLDSGDSWNRVGAVLSVKKDEYSIGNPHILALPSGRLLCAHRSHRRNKDTSTGYATFGITVHQSDDGGETWKKLADVDSRKRTGVDGIWEPFLRLSPTSNKLQVFWANEMTTDNQDIVYQESSDLGQTWSKPATVAGADYTARDGMPSVVNVAASSRNSQAFAVFESGKGPTFVVDYVKTMKDNDDSQWGGRSRIYTPKNNLQAGAPWVINVGGTLVVSFMTNEDTPEMPNVDGGELKIVTSKDLGKTWSSPVVVGKKGSHWPGIMALNDKEFLVTWSQDGSGMLAQKFATS